jgi:hypothetical protein
MSVRLGPLVRGLQRGRRLRLTLGELAEFPLPVGRRVTQQQAYYQLFHFKRDFIRAVSSLRRLGRMPSRKDRSFRIWDLYSIIREVGSLTRFSPPAVSSLSYTTNRFPDLLTLRNLDEAYFVAVERMHLRRFALSAASYLRSRQDASTGQSRDETAKEFRRRFAATGRLHARAVKALARTLPKDRHFWQSRLRSHITLTIELREYGFGNAARLCESQLNAATELAQLRTHLPYRRLRAFVGKVRPDLTMPGLTAASSSVERRGFDLTLDRLVENLRLYNRRVSTPLRVTPAAAQQFLEFLGEAGLQEWYVEYAGATWPSEQFVTSSPDRRIATAFGRIRTLTVLMEDMLLALAERLSDSRFRTAVESSATLGQRLPSYFKHPKVTASVFDWAKCQSIFQNYCRQVDTPPIAPTTLAKSFSKLGLVRGIRIPPKPRIGAESAIASIWLIRNITSHRFPLSREGLRPDWFSEWGDRLPSINRTILWAALVMWSVSEHIRK